MDPLLPLAAFVPCTGAAVLAGVGGRARRPVVDALALGTAVATLGLTVALLARATDHRLVHWFSGWRPQGGVAIGVDFTADGLGAATAVMVAALALAGWLFTWRYLETGEHHLHVLMLLFEGGMIGFALSGDLFIFFVFFELMSVAAYALTGLKIGEAGPLEGAINFAVINSVGSFALLLGIGLLYGHTGALNFAQIGRALAGRGPAPVVVIALVGIGLMSDTGLAGAGLYVAGHGMVKAGLFVLVGVLLHRRASVDEEHLRGQGRGMWLIGALFTLGGLGLAGLPPFGTSLGKSLIEEAGHHYAWLPWLFGFAGVLTGGAVLRAAGRVFLGWGPDEPDPYGSTPYPQWGEEQRETTSAFDRTPAVLVIPALLLLGAGLAIGLVPRGAEHAEVAAAAFRDRGAYDRAVLDGTDRRTPAAP